MTAQPEPVDDQLAQLEARLDALADEPVDRHPDVLDEVHQAVVAELNALSRLGAVVPDEPRG